MKVKTFQTGLIASFLFLGMAVQAQMSGTYTIDPSGSGSRNYTSMTAAVSALYQKAGINGPVVFNVADGIYTGSYLDFSTEIVGASAKNTVKFTGNTKDRSKVVFRSSSTYAVRLYGVDHVHFEYMNFEAASSYCLYFYTNADHNSFRHCDLSGASSYQAYVYQSEYNEFEDCNVEGGSYGFRIYGWSTSQRLRGTKLIDCNISQASSYNLYSYYTDSLEIEGCHFSSGGSYNIYLRYTYDMVMNKNLSDNSNSSLYSYYSVRSVITNNEFNGGGLDHAYENYTGYGVSTDTSIFANNCIYSSGVSSYGWYPYYCWQTKFYHNSIDVTGTTYGTYMYYPEGSIIKNNNWKSVGGGTYGAWVYFSATAYQPKEFSHNNLDWSSSQNFGVFMNYGFANFASLVGYTALSAYTTGLSNFDADFESNTNLRSYSPNINNTGIKLSESIVAKDIDGNPRPASGDTKVDMGANDYYLSPYDLDIFGLVAPKSVSLSANKITVSLRNRGSSTLGAQTIELRYRIDKGKWISESYSMASLDAGKIVDFTFSQTWTPTGAGDYNLEVEISKQVSGDPDKTDVQSWDICTGLSGTYTVGGSSPDFKTVSEAIEALRCGLAGATTFSIRPGTYTEQVVFNGEIFGTSSTNTLIIDGGHQDSVTVQYEATSAASSGTFEMDGCGFVTVRNLTIRSLSTTYGFTVHSYNGAHDNVVENCKILNTNATSTNCVGIALCGASYTASTNNYNNVFENNILRGHGIAVTNYGLSNSPTTSSGIQFVNNDISDCYSYGLRVYYNNELLIDGNKLYNPRGTSFYPMYFGYNSKSVYQNNEVGDYYAYQLYWYRENYYSQQDTSVLQNNIFYGESSYTSTTYGYGSYVQYPYNCKIYHNTFRYKDSNLPTSATGVNIGGALKIYYAYGLDLQNNIFQSVHNSSVAVPLLLSSVYTWVNMDGNNFIHPGGTVINIDGSNFNSISDLQANLPGMNLNSVSEPVYYVSANDLHLTDLRQNSRSKGIGVLSDVDGDSRCTMAPSIGADESAFPEPKTRAFFAIDDTLFVNASSVFNNQAKSQDALLHTWSIDGIITSREVDLEHRFTASGSYTVSLLSEGCGGVDSFQKIVYVVVPKAAPKAEFYISKTVVDVNETIEITNSTTEGADSFYWLVDSYFVMGPNGVMEPSHVFVNGTDSNSLNPQLKFIMPGTYTLCLYAYNLRGADSTCKTKVISVRSNVVMCDLIKESNRTQGKLLDEGGLGAYSANSSCKYLIDPCTDEIRLTINQLDLAAGSYLRIYDGKNENGIPLHAYDTTYKNGFTGTSNVSGFKTNFVAKSGEVYVEFVSAGNVASGFEIEWDANIISPSQPVVDFIIPDTICANIPFVATNTTTGQDVDFKWIMDTTAITWFTGYDYDTRDAVHEFKKTGNIYIKLIGQNCGGADSIVKMITVVKPSAIPSPQFSVSNARPAIGDPVYLLDKTKLGTYPCLGNWEWTIHTKSYKFVEGFGKFDQNPAVYFTDTGCFDITLKVGNDAGSNTTTVTCAVNPYSICVPTVKSTGSGVGITRVAFSNIDNSSNINSNGYEDFSKTVTYGKLEKGATYDITVESAISKSNINRAVWIDFDQDGEFSNAELVASAKADANNSWTGTFSISTKVSSGFTRLRVGTNIGVFKQYGCGPNQFGEFEDYYVKISDDSKPPVVFLNGTQDTTIEQCSNWNDPGAFAIDNVNGRLNTPTNVSGKVDESQVGVYVIQYEFKDSLLNTGYGERIVRVISDYTAPVIVGLGKTSDTIEVFDAYFDLGVSASDNCDGNITTNVTSFNNIDTATVGKYSITYSVSDKEGNVGSLSRDVYVIDTKAPTVTLNGSDSIFVEVYGAYNELGATVIDNYNTGLSANITGMVNPYVLGTYTLEYTAVDYFGNASTEVERKVVVGDTTKPILGLTNEGDTLTLNVMTGVYNAEDLLISDNYYSNAEVKKTIQISGTYAVNFGIGSPASSLGVYSAIYTGSDGSGNENEVVRYIEVVDIEAPTFTFNDAQVVTIARWENYVDPGITATDNYDASGDLVITSTGSFDKNVVGNYQIEYCVVDLSGNKTCATKTIVVQETKETVSVPEVSAIEANVYPNPTSGNLTIQVNLLAPSRVQISIVNALGAEVMPTTELTGDHFELTRDLSNLSSGIYYVQIVDDNERLIKKIILTD